MAKPKKILNDPTESVSEFISGLLVQYPNHLRQLQNHHVVLSAEVVDAVSSSSVGPAGSSSNGVVLVSGGGSGHEPSHAGWIGSGMLSGAVCGGIFASPSVHSILAAIRAVAPRQSRSDSGDGVLLVIKNYTGDRLNFGMAAERAAQEGIRVEMVVVADDCALPRTKGITGARGVAGTVLVHKIAGAAAASSKGLSEVRDVARRVCSRMGTLGFALDSVTVPGADSRNDRLDENTIEIGLGIHGEAGLRQSPLLTANELAKELVGTIQAFGRTVTNESGMSEIVPMMAPGDEVVALVNNLGGTSNFELSILASACVRLLEGEEYGVRVTRVLVGSYMTSFDMRGASLTILNVQDESELVELLDAPTSAPAWSRCDVWKGDYGRPSAVLVPEVVADDNVALELRLPELTVAEFAPKARAMVLAAATKLAASESLLTQYDTIVGDGDCGITFARGALEIKTRLASGALSVDHPVTMFSGLAEAVSASMGGTSGVLLELMFRKMSSMLSRVESIGAAELCAAYSAGVDAVSLYGGASVGARTMLDALVPSASSLVATQNVQDAAVQARQGADSTAQMTVASAGRSNYLSEVTLQGTPDPGAVAVALVFESFVSE